MIDWVIILNQPSYSLGKLSRSLGIPISDRHRASGDASATVQLFKLLLEKDISKNIIQNSVKFFDNRLQKKKLQKLIDKTPAALGLFFIHDDNGRVIYIGSGNNIKAELNNLFLKETKRALQIQDRATSITFEKSGNNLFMHLKYAIELEILKPKYNFIKKIKFTTQQFNNENCLLIHKGRTPEEHAVILIEGFDVYGYGYTNLSLQENNIDILKNIVTPIEHKILAKTIIKNYLNKNKVKKIIRF